MSRPHSIDRRAGCREACRRPERAGRSRRQALSRSDRHAGERLSRRTPGRTQPAASGRSHALAAGPTLRHFPPGGTGVQPGRERLLDLSFRSHAPQPRDQGDARPQPGPLRCGFAAGPQPVRTERHPPCGRRNRESHRHRLCHGIERSHHQSRSARREYREALRGPSSAMSELRPQEAARPAPCAGADRAWRRQQADHDQRGIPDGFTARHGGAFPQPGQPAHRRDFGARTGRSRRADEHQLLCGA